MDKNKVVDIISNEFWNEEETILINERHIITRIGGDWTEEDTKRATGSVFASLKDKVKYM